MEALRSIDENKEGFFFKNMAVALDINLNVSNVNYFIFEAKCELVQLFPLTNN